jgi:hypothetical protein
MEKLALIKNEDTFSKGEIVSTNPPTSMSNRFSESLFLIHYVSIMRA